MDMRKRKLKGYFILSVLIIILSLCLSLAMPNLSSFEPNDVAQAAAVTANTASVLNLNASGAVSDNFSNAIEGGQKQYIYYGNSSGAAIKWRVLSTTEAKYNSSYSSDNPTWLLWADTSLGEEQYNLYYRNPNYAYWSTSKIRATLNGGKYLNLVSDATAMPALSERVEDGDSYYNTFFTTSEQANIVATGSYNTVNCGYVSGNGLVNGETGEILLTTNIVGDEYGKYAESNVNSMNALAANRSASVNVSGTSVIETTSGDYLFLLDYNDINTSDYGFYDPSTNKTYANMINANWSKGSNWYPSNYDAGDGNCNGTNAGIKVDYLMGEFYWLRPAARYSYGSCVLRVHSEGRLGCPDVNETYGIRPAFNFSPSKIVYATAASAGGGTTFSAVNSFNSSDGKPAYKVYMKADGFTTYSDVKLTIKDSELSIEKSGASGRAIVLLSDKSGSGVVAYQATAPINGGIAKVNLGGVNPRDYSITVLFANSLNGGQRAEFITGSYTKSGHTIVPQAPSQEKKEDIKYYNNGNDVTFELENVYENSNEDSAKWVDVTIKGKKMPVGEQTEGEEFTLDSSKWSIDPSTHKLTFNVSEVGTYTVTIKRKNGQECWADLDAGEKTFTYKLKYKLTDVSLKTSTTTYNGKDQYFELVNYDEDKMTITPAPVNISEDESVKKWAIKVKDYIDKEKEPDNAKVKVELKNTTYMVWDDKDLTTEAKYLEFTVNKKALTATPVKTEAWKAEVNAKDTTYDLWIDCFEEDLETIKFEGYYKKGNEAEKSVATAPAFVKEEDNYVKSEDGKKYKLKITLPEISEKGDYKYILKLASQGSTSNKNYSLSFEKDFATDNKSIDIKAEDIVWQYKNYLLTDNNFKTIEAGENITVETSGSDKIFCVTYNEKEFAFAVDTQTETSKLKPYASDVDFTVTILGSDGNVINGEDGKPITSITDVLLKDSKATYYTIKLKITAKEGKTGLDIKTTEFTIKWKINQAVFDLSEVKWDYDPKKPREYNGGKNLEVKLTGLPAVLIPNYYDDDKGEDSNISSKVCEQDSDGKYKPYTAKVVFKFNDKLSNIADIKNNYILPNKDDTSSYIYKEKNDDGDLVAKAFPWELEWVVKKAEIDLAPDWEKVAKEDKNKVVFRPFEVSDTTKASRIVYEYYEEDEWDNTNGVVVGNATPKKLTDIVVDLDSDPVKYWVVARVNEKNSANYEIKKGTEAKKFTVGAGVVIDVDMNKEFVYDGKTHGLKSEFKFNGKGKDEHDAIADIIVKKYYLIEKGEDGEEDKRIELAEGEAPTKAGVYIVSIDFEDEQYQDNFALSSYNITFEITQAELTISLTEKEFVYSDNNVEVNLKITCDNKLDVSNVKIKKMYYLGEEIKEDGSNMLTALPKNVGKYIVVLSIDEDDEDNFRNYKIKEGCTQFSFEITSAQITAVWDTTGDTPVLSGLTEDQAELIEYVYLDEDGNEYEKSELEAGKTYTAVARIKSEYADNYVFVDKKGSVLTVPTETDKSFEIKLEDPIIPNEPENPLEPAPGVGEGNFLNTLKENWVIIVIIISLILIIIFASKTIAYENKRKQAKKTTDNKYKNVFAISLFGLSASTLTLIACVLAGATVLLFICMLVAKSRCGKALNEMDEAKEEYERSQRENENKHRDEQMQMMLMGMMGGNSNGAGAQGFAFQQGVSADEMRLMINDAMTNMLPSVTQYLPQEASYNDELVQQLIEQNAQNEEVIKNLAQGQEMLMQRLAEQSKDTVGEEVIEKLVDKLAKQQAVEREAEREVAAAGAKDEAIKDLNKSMDELKEIVAQMAIASARNGANDREEVKNGDQIEALVKANESLMRNQEMLMKQIVELSNKGNDKSSPIVMPIMPQPAVVQQPVMPQPVYQQPVYQQPVMPPPAEKVVERIVEKTVPMPMPVEKPAKAEKTPVQRLTLDEAYAKLSASQRKIFDTLKNYALSKDKCKENKSTYFTVLGQSSVNPLVKLTIKKNTTVAMFKMEDEYMKDIRKSATSDGAKIKVKETELVVSDATALAAAKNMVDLREDQIERYNEYLKEQRSMKKK